MSIDYRPRLSVDITEEQSVRKQKLIPAHGLQKALFQIILDDLLDLIEENGGIVIGLILDKRVKPRDIIPSLKGSIQHGNDR